MARRTLTTAAAFAATATLLLTACGGSNDDSSDGIKGADTGSSSPSASTSKANSDAPDLSLPGDLHLVFDFAKPSDSKHAAALDTATNYIRALKHGIVKQNPDDPAYQYYSVGGAAKYAKSQIQAWVDGGWTATGTDKYFNADTANVGSTGVLVTFCRNQAKSYSKKIKTGKTHYTKESLDSYQKFTILMRPSPGSTQSWKAQQIEVQGRVKECQG
ncbi:hypothetical protein [Streptomyces sp. R41]|uniref:Lipoprotein n=1 Tax=Streptomyces sp. R41 TaxID=3238632 RepID=A0AB39RM14_9ACTN